uniref:AIPP2-like SPOC-like domain-containing protein n=1 Tax=Arundo donax TaxID=35708 RepID=A0A0A9HQB3_ARUDO
MPAKRRRLSNQDTRLSGAEYHDDSNSCVTGKPAEGKPLVEKKKLLTSASSRDLTVKDYKDSSVASHSRLRSQCVNESTEKKGSDVHDVHPSSSGRLFPANSSSVMTKKLLRTQSSVSTSKGLSPKRQPHELGKTQDNLSRQHSGKVSLSNNIIEQPTSGKLNPCVVGGDNHGMLTGCSTSNRNENKAGFSRKDLDNVTSCSKDEIQEHADIQSNDDAKRNGGDKQDWGQDSSMDVFSDGKSNKNIHNDAMTDCGNSEGLIDVNVCDICGDVGREYLLATCTRCLEGAEHTYCMRVKLDRVPDGEWLCEECQLKEDQSKIKRKYGVATVNILEGKNQSSESRNNPKVLQVAVPNLDAPQITCSTPTADQCDAKNQKFHLVSDTQARQVKVTATAAERLDVKNKNLSMANRKKLQVITSDLEARPHTNGTPTAGSSNKKNQSSEFWLNRKKLRVCTDMESPLSNEGVWSPPVSCKRLAENTSSPTPRLFKTDSLRKHDVFSRENSFKKSNKESLKSLDNAPMRTTQVVKNSQTLSRSYSLGSMMNAKAPVPSPRGPLSKQLSFNSSNNAPKVKQLAEGVASRLRDPTYKGPIKKFVKSGSFKCEGSVCRDAESSKQKQSVHMSQDENPGILKPMKEKNLIERRASFSFKKPNIPSSPRPDSSMKSGERKIDQDISRSGPSKLRSSKKPGNVEKKQSSDLSKSDKQDVTVHQKPVVVSGKDAYTVKISDPRVPSQCVKKDSSNDDEDESADLSKSDKQDDTVHRKPVVVSGKDAYAVKISDPRVPSQCVKKDSSNDGEDVDSFVSVKNGNKMPTEPPEVLTTTCAALICESDLRDIVPSASALEDSASKLACCQQKSLESTVNDSCDIRCQQKSSKVEPVQASENLLPESPRVHQMAHNIYPTENKLDKPNLKQEAFVDQSSTLGNPSRELVIPEQSYIWQGCFEVSRHGNSPEMFDGIQAYLSTCASSKVREVGKQLPHKIQLAEVPWHSSWPLQFKEANPTEDSIALFFFAKDVESYQRAYGKLLENVLLGDLSLTANIGGGTELLIFPSDKLPESTQRWNGLLFFWGIFYARKASTSLELPVTGTNNCPSEPITKPVIKHDLCSPKVLQSLGIDLNECPNDDLSDPGVSLGLELEKSGASTDHNTLLESKHGDRRLNACETHHEETTGIRQIVLGHPTAAPWGTHFPTMSTGEGRDMMQDYPSAAKGTTGKAGRGNMEAEDGFVQDEALFCVAQQAGAIRSISDEIIAKKHALLPSVEISRQHFSGSKISDGPSELILKSDMGSLDSGLSYKRQKTFHGKHSTFGFRDALLPSRCMSKIHPLQAGHHNPFDDVQNIYRGPSDPGSLKNPIPDNVIHVLSSDDEDSPEPSTSLNKASLKADEGSSPLLSLSLSTVAKKHGLAGSNIGDDEPLSLSLGLPSVMDGSRALEMKQFLPEKPGINT